MKASNFHNFLSCARRLQPHKVKFSTVSAVKNLISNISESRKHNNGAYFDLLLATAFLWGLAEATIFFIVPDVILTAIAIFSLPRALRALTFSLLGATIGGLGIDCKVSFNFFVTFFDAGILYYTEARPDLMPHWLTQIPGVTHELLIRAQNLEERRGLFSGMLLGMHVRIVQFPPHKIYLTRRDCWSAVQNLCCLCRLT